jgi:hypothetical protein
VRYIPSGSETDVFEAAWKNALPVLLKGPTALARATRGSINKMHIA